MKGTDAPGGGRTVGGWPWRNVGQAIVGLLGGGGMGAKLLENETSGWNLIGFYLALAAVFLVFAVLRPRDRAMCIGAYVGMTLTIAVMVLFVSG